MGRYRLVLPIGSGATATVYLARTNVGASLSREVAVKLMHPKLDADDGHFADELMDEARIVARIRHPNVVSVLEVGDDPHGVFLVMEYVHGETLSRLTRKLAELGRPLPLDVACRIVCDALLGLHHAHELRGDDGELLELVHRDFSPQNLLVDVSGVTRLTDFGIARVINRSNRTASGVIKGKVSYMSPEQALGEPLDRRSDVWAAGVVAWELLAGRTLYETGEDASVLLRIVSHDPPDVKSVRPDVPEACAKVVGRALERNRALRFDNALEFREALLGAFRQSVGVAEVDGVGALVRETVGDDLAERERRSKSTPDEPPERALPAQPARPAAKRGVAAVALLLAAAGAAAAVALRSANAPMPAHRAPAAGSASDAPLPAEPPSAPRDQTVSITANAPIAGLSLGGRAIYIPKATPSVVVQLPNDVAFPLVLEARALDGRVARSELFGGTPALSIEFARERSAVAPPARAKLPSGPPRRAESARPALAPPPYK